MKFFNIYTRPNANDKWFPAETSHITRNYFVGVVINFGCFAYDIYLGGFFSFSSCRNCLKSCLLCPEFHKLPASNCSERIFFKKFLNHSLKVCLSLIAVHLFFLLFFSFILQPSMLQPKLVTFTVHLMSGKVEITVLI